ncbi:MAG: nucleoside triphosphate pyrophosphohydrolase [Alphaproteobacteria bacterium]|nr:nucleoside triphosphate pyrophosphohydrolase [Alphaproteobacteria bacterium]
MSKALDDLLAVMVRLRDPDTGCPWDIKQDFKSIAPCTLEEAYEVVEAIESNDSAHFCEELGDLLLQIVFHARMAEEQNLFTFEDVARGQAEKMIERHPHVFGDRQGVATAADVLKNWEADKAKKRAENAPADAPEPHSALDGVSTALPALTRAAKLQKRAARVGFDWKEPAPFVAKIREELAEVESEMAAGSPKERLEAEIGDLLFAVIGLASHLGVDAERALRGTNRRFDQRFRFVEKSLMSQGQTMEETSLTVMEKLWEKAKGEANC